MIGTKGTWLIVLAVGLLALLWYFFDGRYLYVHGSSGDVWYRVDRLTGEPQTCTKYGCK
jgi:hypothetical protein